MPADRWDRLEANDTHEIRDVLATLPDNIEDGDAHARNFDLRCISLQLSLLESSKDRTAKLEALLDVLAALAQRKAPQVLAKLDFIHAMTEPIAWTNPSAEQVEQVRVELREVMRFIDHRRATAIYTDFEDALLTSAVEDRDVPIYPATGDAYRRRVTQFIRDHRDHLAIAKLRTNKPARAARSLPASTAKRAAWTYSITPSLARSSRSSRPSRPMPGPWTSERGLVPWLERGHRITRAGRRPSTPEHAKLSGNAQVGYHLGDAPPRPDTPARAWARLRLRRRLNG